MKNPPRSDVAHQRLVRAAVLTIQLWQGLIESLTPEQQKVAAECFDMLSNGLKGQSIRDEEVVITRQHGMIEVTHKTEFVKVTIKDLDATK